MRKSVFGLAAFSGFLVAGYAAYASYTQNAVLATISRNGFEQAATILFDTPIQESDLTTESLFRESKRIENRLTELGIDLNDFVIPQILDQISIQDIRGSLAKNHSLDHIDFVPYFSHEASMNRWVQTQSQIEQLAAYIKTHDKSSSFFSFELLPVLRQALDGGNETIKYFSRHDFAWFRSKFNMPREVSIQEWFATPLVDVAPFTLGRAQNAAAANALKLFTHQVRLALSTARSIKPKNDIIPLAVQAEQTLLQVRPFVDRNDDAAQLVRTLILRTASILPPVLPARTAQSDIEVRSGIRRHILYLESCMRKLDTPAQFQSSCPTFNFRRNRPL